MALKVISKNIPFKEAENTINIEKYNIIYNTLKNIGNGFKYNILNILIKRLKNVIYMWHINGDFLLVRFILLRVAYKI